MIKALLLFSLSITVSAASGINAIKTLGIGLVIYQFCGKVVDVGDRYVIQGFRS
jgi:hypothetical protein